MRQQAAKRIENLEQQAQPEEIKVIDPPDGKYYDPNEPITQRKDLRQKPRTYTPVLIFDYPTTTHGL